MKRAIAVFTKVPIAGQVKTRMIPFLTQEQAAELQEYFLLDTLDLAMGINNSETIIAYTPKKALNDLKKRVKAQLKYIPQKGSETSERVYNVFKNLFSEGYTHILLIDADSPTLPQDLLNCAFNALEKNDLVIGPTVDGGCFLIGLKSLYEKIFCDINLGLVNTLHQTIDQGYRLYYVDTWYDIDTYEDLGFLAWHVEYLKKRGLRSPSRTVKFLEKLDRDQFSPFTQNPKFSSIYRKVIRNGV